MIDLVRERLQRAGCVAAEIEAEWLLEAAAGDGLKLESMLARREQGEPVEHIVGWAPFAGLRLSAGPGTFVPRAQTELMAERAVALLAESAPPTVAVDLCTGIGGIAVLMATRVPAAEVHATEIDAVAASHARANAPANMHVHEGSLDEPLADDLRGRVSVLTANAPYVPRPAARLLPRDTLAWEPAHALLGGEDGLEIVRLVVALAPRWLRPGGHLVVECGIDQAAPLAAILGVHGLVLVDLLEDAEGDLRGAVAGWPG